MPDVFPPPLRVLLANLDPIVRLGLARALADDGIEVVGEEHEGDTIVLTAGQSHPDAIVLGADEVGSEALGKRLRAASPETKLILFVRDEHGLQVLDPRAKRPRTIHAPILDTLLAELSDSRSNTEETHA